MSIVPNERLSSVLDISGAVIVPGLVSVLDFGRLVLFGIFRFPLHLRHLLPVSGQ
jgi:hypothetical protein